jgi:hypothetical protein
MPYGTDHDRFVKLFKSRSGQVLKREQIIDIVQKAHPTLARSSIMPSDHDNIGNKGECGCRKFNHHVFERFDYGMYKVR